LAKLSIIGVSLYEGPTTAASVGVSFAAVIDTVYVAVVDNAPSDTLTVNVSDTSAVRALIALALGVNV
jgi:hypothetical protein